MGAGHVVIAFYEIIPADSGETIDEQTFDEISELRYTGENHLDELMYLAIRYKDPNSDTSELIEYQTYESDYSLETSETFNFASAVVEFGLLLRDSAYKYEASFDQVISRANTNLGDDEYGYRDEFVELVEIAERLMSRR
jgi:Ca-activated chloride channel family protein